MERLDARVEALEHRLYQLETRYVGRTREARLKMAIGCSIVLHLAVILGIRFQQPDPQIWKSTSQAMDVVLVNAKSQNRPVKADAHAQANLDGGGTTDAKRRATSPLPVTPDSVRDRELATARQRVQQLEQEAKRVMTQVKPTATTVPATTPQPERQPETRPAVSAADILQRSALIARMEAEIARDWQSEQERPRRRFVGARTQEFRFARYIEDWRQKVERIGELNYPQAARDQKLYGSLVVTVSIKADGTLEKVEINRPSGHKILDEAAVRIVRLAAPYAPFPADIMKDTDVLSITRTWTFTRTDELHTQ